MLRILLYKITAGQPSHSSEPQRRRTNAFDAEDSQLNRALTLISSTFLRTIPGMCTATRLSRGLTGIPTLTLRSEYL